MGEIKRAGGKDKSVQLLALQLLPSNMSATDQQAERKTERGVLVLTTAKVKRMTR